MTAKFNIIFLFCLTLILEASAAPKRGIGRGVGWLVFIHNHSGLVGVVLILLVLLVLCAIIGWCLKCKEYWRHHCRLDHEFVKSNSHSVPAANLSYPSQPVEYLNVVPAIANST